MKLSTFSLDRFEGPLDLLIYLIGKEEIDVREISLTEVTKQFAEQGLDQIDEKAETLFLAASLLLIKSRSLIPNQSEEQTQEMGNRTLLIERLIEYCRFKEAAKELTERERSQLRFFPRNAPDVVLRKDSGLDEVSLEGLSQKLRDVLARFESQSATLEDDTWQIAPKITWLKTVLASKKELQFEQLFTDSCCKEEVIVIFLALLEIMKEGEAHIEKNEGKLLIYGRN